MLPRRWRSRELPCARLIKITKIRGGGKIQLGTVTENPDVVPFIYFKIRDGPELYNKNFVAAC